MQVVPGSYRDPAGFVFEVDGVLLRHVDLSFAEELDALHRTGLYDELAGEGRLVSHEFQPAEVSPGAHAVLRPERVPFVSYPYEWSFSQLRDAALLTLDVQRRALARGMILRDASAFNVQWRGVEPVFIDTLSFGRYRPGQPWYAYRQFCEHFLNPLALMSRLDVRLSLLLRDFPDGIPMGLASRLLGAASWLRPGLAFHVHLHARLQDRYADREQAGSGPGGAVSLRTLQRMADHLAALVESFGWRPEGTSWAGYADLHNYSGAGLHSKAAVVRDFLARLRPASVWDLGANTGEYSRISAGEGRHVLAVDGDPGAVELSYRALKKERFPGVLPLVMDLLNPSPGLGWEHRERGSLAERGPADVVLGLALVHHLCLAGNVPLERVARFFRSVGRAAVVEFVPPGDGQVERLLSHRSAPPHRYDREEFERSFARWFRLEGRREVEESERAVYLWTAREDADA